MYGGVGGGWPGGHDHRACSFIYPGPGLGKHNLLHGARRVARDPVHTAHHDTSHYITTQHSTPCKTISHHDAARRSATQRNTAHYNTTSHTTPHTTTQHSACITSRRRTHQQRIHNTNHLMSTPVGVRLNSWSTQHSAPQWGSICQTQSSTRCKGGNPRVPLPWRSGGVSLARGLLPEIVDRA